MHFESWLATEATEEVRVEGSEAAAVLRCRLGMRRPLLAGRTARLEISMGMTAAAAGRALSRFVAERAPNIITGAAAAPSIC